MAIKKYYELSSQTYSGLEAGETLIGKGMMTYWVPVLSIGNSHSCNSNSGTLYVTGRRVFFRTMWSDDLEFELKLPEILGFTVGKRAFFITQVTIHTRKEEKLWFTGFYAKKMQDWLRQAGIPKLQTD